MNVTVQLHGAAIGPATVARVDDMHANAYSAWLRMGSPKADGNGTLSGQAPSWDGTSGKRFPAQCHAAPCRGARGELTVRFPRPPPLTPFFVGTQVLAALHAAAQLQEESLAVRRLDSGAGTSGASSDVGAAVTLQLPHHGVARVRLALA